MLSYLKKHTWLITCFLAVVLIPQSLTLQSKLEGRLIITGLAIDKMGEEYQITCQTVSPSSGLISGKDAAGIDFVTVTAATIREGINKVASTTTKSSGLGHLNFIVIGESVLNEDITSVIDFIVRDAHTDTSALMLVAKNANEEIKKTKDLELGTAIQLRKAFLSKHSMCNGVMTIANKFLSSKFAPSASSVLSYLEIKKEPNSQNTTNPVQQQSTNENETQSAPQSSSEQLIKQGRLSYYSPLALFRDGRHRKTFMSENEIVGYNMLCCTSNNLISGFGNITQEDGTKAKITMFSKTKSTKVSVEIKDEIPHISVNIKLSKNQILELIPEENSLENYKTQQNYLTNDVREQISQQLKQKALLAYSSAAESGVDILEAATRLRRQHKKQYSEYFSNHTLDDFLHEAILDLNVVVSKSTK